MNVRRSLESRIRGWFPKEPTLPSKSRQPQVRQENKPLSKRPLSASWRITLFVLYLVYFYLFIYQFSTIVLILIGVTIALGLTWLLLRTKSNNNIVKTFKYALIALAIFALAFESAGIYLFNFSGPLVPQISFPSVLDTSLAPQLQNLEQSISFRFLQAEHLGTLTFQDLTIVTTYSNAPGGLDWTFYARDVRCKTQIGQSGGKPYSYLLVNLFRSYSLPQDYPSNQEITESFNQIDSLGLHWFYDQAILEYQNATGAKPAITDLRLVIAFNNVGNYQGITLLMTGQKAGHDNFGNKIYPTVFAVEFQPNGNILSTRNTPGV
jgi:hypothetical protein